MLVVINFAYELDIIMTRYDFLEAWGVICNIILTNSQLDLILPLVNFCGQKANY